MRLFVLQVTRMFRATSSEGTVGAANPPAQAPGQLGRGSGDRAPARPLGGPPASSVETGASSSAFSLLARQQPLGTWSHLGDGGPRESSVGCDVDVRGPWNSAVDTTAGPWP